MKITIRVQRFIDEYMIDGNASRAYRAAYNCAKSKDKTIVTNASLLLADTDVAKIVQTLRKRVTESKLMTVKDVLVEFQQMATADVGKIVQHRRLNCRHCNGANFAYQWRDVDEFAKALQVAHDNNLQRRKNKQKAIPIPTDDGGYGFRRTHDPHSGCPKCDGEGIEDVFIADTRKLTGPERKMIAGIEVKQHGVKVTLHDQKDAMKNVGHLLGGFKNVTILQNPDGTPLAGNATPVLPVDPKDAADAYADFMKGK